MFFVIFISLRFVFVVLDFDNGSNFIWANIFHLNVPYLLHLGIV